MRRVPSHRRCCARDCYRVGVRVTWMQHLASSRRCQATAVRDTAVTAGNLRFACCRRRRSFTVLSPAARKSSKQVRCGGRGGLQASATGPVWHGIASVAIVRNADVRPPDGLVLPSCSHCCTFAAQLCGRRRLRAARPATVGRGARVARFEAPWSRCLTSAPSASERVDQWRQKQCRSVSQCYERLGDDWRGKRACTELPSCKLASPRRLRLHSAICTGAIATARTPFASPRSPNGLECSCGP